MLNHNTKSCHIKFSTMIEIELSFVKRAYEKQKVNKLYVCTLTLLGMIHTSKLDDVILIALSISVCFYFWSW